MSRHQDNGKGKLLFKGTAKVFPGRVIIRTGLVMLIAYIATNLLGQGPNVGKNATAVALAIAAYGILRLIWEWLRNRFRRFAIYQRGVEFTVGLLWQQKAFLWLGYIDEITFRRSHWDWLGGTATVVLSAPNIWQSSTLLASSAQSGTKASTFYKLPALGNKQFMEKLYDALRDTIKKEREKLPISDARR